MRKNKEYNIEERGRIDDVYTYLINSMETAMDVSMRITVLSNCNGREYHS